MSTDLKRLFDDNRPFWMLPTVDHDLRKNSKAEEPTVRKYTINPRLNIEKLMFIQLVQDTTLQSIIDNITLKNPNDEIKWKGDILKRGSPQSKIARAIFNSMKTVICVQIDYMVGKEVEKKKQERLKKLGKKYRGVTSENTQK